MDNINGWISLAMFMVAVITVFFDPTKALVFAVLSVCSAIFNHTES